LDFENCELVFYPGPSLHATCLILELYETHVI